MFRLSTGKGRHLRNSFAIRSGIGSAGVHSQVTIV
jgi:hypothetical protein